MPDEVCPLCKKKSRDIIKHFSINHEIGDIDQLNSVLYSEEVKQKRVEEYHAFINDINEKLHTHKITMEEWKRLRDSWKSNIE